MVSLHQSRRGQCGVGRNWPGGVALGFRGASTRVYSLYIFLAVCHHLRRICTPHLILHHVTLSPAAISRGVLVCVQVRSMTLSATRTSHHIHLQGSQYYCYTAEPVARTCPPPAAVPSSWPARRGECSSGWWAATTSPTVTTCSGGIGVPSGTETTLPLRVRL